MPTYQYVCTACDQPLEAVQSFSDAALTECPACSGRLRKVYGAVGVVFKGSGFYKTDSRKGNGAGTEGASTTGDGGKADSGTSEGGKSEGGKADGKKDAAPAPAAAPAAAGSTGSGSGTAKTPAGKTA